MSLWNNNRHAKKSEDTGKAKPHGRRYPWKEWFSQDRFTLTRGKDYDSRTDTLCQQVRATARKAQYHCVISIKVAADGESFTVRVKERLGTAWQQKTTKLDKQEEE